MVARRVQDQAGDLATAVEESVHGIRVLKAFGAARTRLQKFRSQAEKLRGTELGQGPRDRSASGCGSCSWSPDVAFALCLLGGVVLAVGRSTDPSAA